MAVYKDSTYTGERALFALKDSELENCIFEDGESPLKEGRNLKLNKCTFNWKYPLWYNEHVEVNNCLISFTARSGVWYTKDIVMTNCAINSPKTFRRAEKVVLENCNIPNAQETFWGCKDVRLTKVNAKGDYFGATSESFEIDNLYLDGNYCFDSSKNIVIRNSTLISKDSFWNSENVTCINCTIKGEYLAWNSKNLTFINCKIESHQGLCYVNGLKMINCELVNSDLCFEYCENIDAELTNVVESIKNPYSGTIRAKGVKHLYKDERFVDPSKTRFIVDK